MASPESNIHGCESVLINSKIPQRSPALLFCEADLRQKLSSQILQDFFQI